MLFFFLYIMLLLFLIFLSYEILFHPSKGIFLISPNLNFFFFFFEKLLSSIRSYEIPFSHFFLLTFFFSFLPTEALLMFWSLCWHRVQFEAHGCRSKARTYWAQFGRHRTRSSVWCSLRHAFNELLVWAVAPV
jgi:hypothetical protein